MLQVEDGTLTVAVPSGNWLFPNYSGKYNHVLFPYMRRWIHEGHPDSYYPPSQRHVIFHTRAGSTPRRVVEKEHEKDIVAAIRRTMKRNKIDLPLVTFNGKDELGNTLPLEEQFDIFRRASHIIGPHGSGLANIMWTNPYPATCEDRTKVLEFIPGTDSATVQFLFNGYYWVMGEYILSCTYFFAELKRVVSRTALKWTLMFVKVS